MRKVLHCHCCHDSIVCQKLDEREILLMWWSLRWGRWQRWRLALEGISCSFLSLSSVNTSVCSTIPCEPMSRKDLISHTEAVGLMQRGQTHPLSFGSQCPFSFSVPAFCHQTFAVFLVWWISVCPFTCLPVWVNRRHPQTGSRSLSPICRSHSNSQPWLTDYNCGHKVYGQSSEICLPCRSYPFAKDWYCVCPCCSNLMLSSRFNM